MKTIRYIGPGTGPALTSTRLSEAYDFSTSGICDMDDADAAILLTSCGSSFKVLDASTVALGAARAVSDGTTVPVRASAVVNSKTLVLTFTELTSLKAQCVPGDFTVLVGGAGNTVTKVTHGAKEITLYLTTAVMAGDTVTVAYDNTTVYDINGNAAVAAVAVAVTNSTPDVTAPVYASSSVNGASLAITYTEAISLHLTEKALPADFAVTVATVARTVTTVTMGANTVTLTLASAVTNGQAVTVAYTRSAHATAFIKDTANNAAASFTSKVVTNVTA